MYRRHMYPTMPATARSPPGTLGETLIRDPADKSDNAESALVVRAVGRERGWCAAEAGLVVAEELHRAVSETGSR